MKNYIKHSFGYILLVIMAVSFFGEVPVYAEDTEYTTPEGYTYTLDADGNAVITDYTGSATILNIPEILDGHRVTTLGYQAFLLCDTLTHVTVPSSVTSVDEYVFGYCSNLVSVSLPFGLNNIGIRMFQCCEKLTGIDIPNSVTSIGRAAFNGCGLVSIHIPDSVTSIGQNAFLECNDLVDVTLSSGLTVIARSAFDECDSLKSIHIPDSVTHIGEFAFSDCRALEDVMIPDSVTTIEQGAFYACTALEELEIPDSVTTIREGAFAYCSALKELILPTSVTEIDKNLFYKCSPSLTVCYPKGLLTEADIVGTGISYVLNADGTVTVTIEKVPDGTTKVSIPGMIMGQQVTAVTASEDVDMSKITVELKVPFTVTSQPVDCRVTYGDTAGAQMTVGVTKTLDTEEVAYQWYENDVAVTGAVAESYILPTDKKAGSYICYCEVTSGEYSIKTAKATVTVDKKPVTVQVDSVTRVKGGENPVFTYTIPSGALVAGDTTADWSVSLTTTATKTSPTGKYEITGTITAENYDVTLIPGVLTVVKSAPKKGANIQDSKNKAVYRVTKAGTKGGTTGTVSYVKPVKAASTVTVPATITVDGIKYKVTSIEKNAFKNNGKLTKVTIGKYVKKIGTSAFYNCAKLKTVKMGSGVSTIGDKAFYKCKAMTKITIPAKVTKIGKQAFYGCKKLKTITVKSKKLKSGKIGKQAFKGIYKKAVIKVPKSKYKTYKSLLKKAGVGSKAVFKKN